MRPPSSWIVICTVCSLAVETGAQPVQTSLVQEIYARLCAAAGLVQGAPLLVFDDSNTRGAGAVTDFKTMPTRIVVERKALETCSTFGDRSADAIAFLLGHELAHFTMGHGWGEDLQHFGDHSEVSRNIRSAQSASNSYHLLETQADQKGAFYAFIAGFAPELVADSLVNRLYTAYGWKSQTTGYPDRPVREELLRKGLSRYQDLAMVMRLADHRLILGQYAEAASLYAFLMGEGFRNPMLYNNAGACHLQQAIAAAPPALRRFTYPVELDLRERWRGAGASMEEELRLAEDLLLQALVLDRSSGSVLVNLACVSLLRNDHPAATHWIAAHAAAEPEDVPTRSILSAILAAQAGDEAKAKALLDQPMLKKDKIATMNRAALEGRSEAVKPPPPATEPERIGGATLVELASGFARIPPVSYRDRALLRHAAVKDSWKLAAERRDAAGNTHWLYLVGTTAHYAGKSSKGIGIGDPLAQLNKLYGEPHGMLHTMEGRLLVYPSNGLIFRTDRSGRVTGWVLFSEKQQ